MCITAHWIALIKRSQSLELQAALITFHCVSGSHDGVNLSATTLKLLDRAEVTDKTGHFTLDGASNNGTSMHEFALLVMAHDIEFDEFDNRVMYVSALQHLLHVLIFTYRCFPHVVNVCCDHIITKITNPQLIDAAMTFVDTISHSDLELQSFEDACK